MSKVSEPIRWGWLSLVPLFWLGDVGGIRWGSIMEHDSMPYPRSQISDRVLTFEPGFEVVHHDVGCAYAEYVFDYVQVLSLSSYSIGGYGCTSMECEVGHIERSCP